MNSNDDLNALFGNAEEDGVLTQASMQALNVNDIGAQIQAGLGCSVDDVASSDVVLMTIMPDDSSSIRFANKSDAVRSGHNLVLDALLTTKQQDNILAHTRYLNGKVLFPYQPIAQSTRMDRQNYSASGGTPLFDQAVVLLGTVLAKTQDFIDNGVPARTITLLITDGEDAGSERARAADVKAIVDDMLRQECHIIAAMGIGDDGRRFRKVFQEMGIRDEWVLTPGDSAEDIRDAFQVFSQSAVRASQTTLAFSRTAMGGFAG